MRHDKGPRRNYSDSADFEALQAVFSHEYLRKYLREADADFRRALHLYDWNTSVSAAFYKVLQWVGIALRNAIQRRLIGTYGDEWYSDPRTGLDHASRGQLENALGRLRQERKPLRSPGIVAWLPFGFLDWASWNKWLDRGEWSKGGLRENSLETYTMQGIPYRPSLIRKNVHKPLDHLRTL